MKLKKMKRPVLILLTLLTVFALAAAQAEVTAVDTEANGKVTQTVWMDSDGSIVPGPQGYAMVRYEYKGAEKTETYYDAEGQPYESAAGCYGRKVTVDGKKRIIQIDYLGADGSRTLNNRGYAMMSISYYGFGGVRQVTYYGLNKKPVTVKSLGYASVYSEYSNRTMTSRTYRNAKGQAVDSQEGYAAVKQKVNKKFQVIRIRYEHADGSPAVGPDGWYRCIIDRDDAGRITSIKYYDTGEELTDRGASYAWEEREYEDDNTVLVTYYDLEGNKAPDDAGVATVVREMQDDRVVRESFLDTLGKPTTNKLGVGAVVYGYDHDGRLESVSYQDTEGSATTCNKGYAGYRDTKDDDGATIGRTFLGTDGLPTEIAGGYSEIRYFYDDTKALTDTRYYNANGTQVNAE